ncbi:MAG TPA: aminomethyl-transferring glycine dehydrogenase subunit GcvPB [Pyrinomonadaceae bacterium]|nr:aminomethyl-transferring glycine dehydrogenase subunit GcvPB [Chloracidobacterium sp.]MBP9935306.1 aminomethyl-transferring glycine dehydrogenase subunit GcvPB [Pyrinomonadaceae bacterium]MBK9768845.1 aminomethyl-transferring glycine dehydrogenase subunit GcvPB [Chloracidobacterium sp.]MBL0240469.1 aminomethyl-transferring glycine dehydrogenase subunit GcvPB [Chloracidobacterium sp.]HQX57173.1 aminomethyl-transferring glycine dehydrogenase subunit GcvPB [Pyrinomonadaceae bacterium]
MSIKKVTQHPTQNEGLIFERSQTGRIGYRLPKLDVVAIDLDEIMPAALRRDDDLNEVPEVSEVDVITHFTRISTWNYSIDLGMYPLGSCTMKYNSRLNEKTARIGGFAGLHPMAPESESQGALELMYRLQQDLAEITGLPGVSLQPAAGAQGEMTGVMLIRAFLDQRDGEASKDRRVMLIPDSAHGTNPASAAMAGFTVKTIHSTPEGFTDMDHLRQLCDEGGVAGLMLTNPNTVGIFEKNIKEICDVIHTAGGLVYMDGANMNALVGIARPGDMGVDVIHLNLHKTFSTPHGGGGPGCGPCCCSAELMPFLPVPRIEKIGDQYALNSDYPASIGRVKAFYGNFGMMVRALSYIYTHGAEGLKEATEAAVLNARYISDKLADAFDKPFDADCMHEAIFSHKNQSKRGVVTLDIAKRLIDYGFHPMTVYFPLVVEGAMLIEPTESVGRVELDAFVDAMIDIDREAQEDPELVINAPHSTRIGRLDEASAARKPVLRWRPDMETMSQKA